MEYNGPRNRRKCRVSSMNKKLFNMNKKLFNMNKKLFKR